jgi:hypothetical protein
VRKHGGVRSHKTYILGIEGEAITSRLYAA